MNDPLPSAEKDAPCDHGANYRRDDDWHCLTCPHVWSVASDPEGWGNVGPNDRHNHDAIGVYANCPACGTVLPPGGGRA